MDASLTEIREVAAVPVDITALTPAAERILDAATGLFYAHGIAAVGVDAVAATSGATKRTLYDRFGSKEALVVAYLQRRDRDWWARWEARIEAAGADAALTVFDAYALDTDPRGRGCAFLNAAAELPDDHPGREVIRDHKRRVRARLGALLEGRVPRSADDGADLLYLLVEGGVSQQAVDGDSSALDRARRLARGLLFP